MPPKHDQEVVGAVEGWGGNYRMLMEEDGEDKLLDKYNMVGLRQWHCGDIKKHM